MFTGLKITPGHKRLSLGNQVISFPACPAEPTSLSDGGGKVATSMCLGGGDSLILASLLPKEGEGNLSKVVGLSRSVLLSLPHRLLIDRAQDNKQVSYTNCSFRSSSLWCGRNKWDINQTQGWGHSSAAECLPRVWRTLCLNLKHPPPPADENEAFPTQKLCWEGVERDQGADVWESWLLPKGSHVETWSSVCTANKT